MAQPRHSICHVIEPINNFTVIFQERVNANETKKQTMKNKLKDVRKLIDEWKREKKSAVKGGNINKARRLANKIKNMQSQKVKPSSSGKVSSLLLENR